ASATAGPRSPALFVQEDVDARALAVARQLNQATHLTVGALKFPGPVAGILPDDRPGRLVQTVGVVGGDGIERRGCVPAGADGSSVRPEALLDTDQSGSRIDGKVLWNAKRATRIPALGQGSGERQAAYDQQPSDDADNGDSHPVRAGAMWANGRRCRCT